jgi:two-component sensor histidine kinase
MSPPTSALASPERLDALRRTGLLDTLPEAQFDRITRLISRLLSAPVALLSLVDTERQFFKSSCGLQPPWSEQRQTPLSHSFCQHVVGLNSPLVVDDARTHPLVADNLAVPDLGVIAYLGVPVASPNGQILGALCAVDTEPRNWSQDDVSLMEECAALVQNEIQLRETTRLASELAEHNAMLAREYHHRVKNTLAVASSLIGLSGRGAKSADEAVSVAQGRLMALASAHDSMIAQSDDVDLAELAKRLLLPYCLPGAEADVEGPPVLLRQRQVTPICLLLHELATNSAKYGALSHHGYVTVRWTQLDDSIVLAWEERSKTIEPKATEGFGSRLIEIAVKQLEGTLTTDWASGRLRVALAFPPQERLGAD